MTDIAILGLHRQAFSCIDRLAAVCVLLTAPCLAPAVAAEAAYFDETQAITLFAFDELAIPFKQNLRLEMKEPQRHPANPVVARGEPGKPDSWAVQFYGSVIREEGKFKMWYVAVGEERLEGGVPRSSPWRVAYAESDDGVKWTKPNLGLFKYRGDTANNLVRLEPRLGVLNVKVIKDEDDAAYPYKLGAHVWWPNARKKRADGSAGRSGTFVPYRSTDGLRWEAMIEVDPVEFEIATSDMALDPWHYEPVGGFYKWDGVYFLSGQNAIKDGRNNHGRVTRQFFSPDLVNWHQASAIGFVRPEQRTIRGRGSEIEQTHEGISAWPRRNVIVGISGMWHGAREWSDITIDLGFVYSHDGVYFREPEHEMIFIERGADGAWDQGGLLQGQGFENVGEQTYIYYGAWDPRNSKASPRRGGVGIVTLPRDHFAQLVVDLQTQGPRDYQMPKTSSSFVSAAIDLPKDGAHGFYVNAQGLGDDAWLRLELLNATGVPMPRFSGDNAAIVRENGFQAPVRWPKHEALATLPNRIRVKAYFEGTAKTDIRYHALYIR